MNLDPSLLRRRPKPTRIRLYFLLSVFAIFACGCQLLRIHYDGPIPDGDVDGSTADRPQSTTTPKSGSTAEQNHHFQSHPSFQSSHDRSPPSKIYVLGERNSGTRYCARRVLGHAFEDHAAALTTMDPSQTHEIFSTNIPILKHKHMFRHSLLTVAEIEDIEHRHSDALWIFVVRSPCDWAEAMRRMPWHVCNPTNISADCPGQPFVGFEHKDVLRDNFTLAGFWQTPWGDWPESTNYRNLSFVGEEFVYDNVFALRAHKLRIMRQIMEVVPRNVKVVRLRELERAPDMLVQNLINEYHLPLIQDYEPQSAVSKRIHKERCLSREEWDVAQRSIDWDVEALFGYGPLDCHMCYSDHKK